MTLNVPAQAPELVAGFEGFMEKPYRCPAGVWTIGFGSTRDGAGNRVTAETPKVSRVAATVLLTRDLQGATNDVARLVKVPLTEPQRAALVSFTYNLGAGNLGASSLLRKLNAGDYKGAADQFLVWNRGGGRVLPGLVTRRETERRLFLSGTK